MRDAALGVIQRNLQETDQDSIVALTFANATEQIIDDMVSRIPTGRMGLSKEIASAARRFWASDDSSFVSGTELAVDGGMNQGQAGIFKPALLS